MFVVKRGEYFRKYNIFEVDFDSGVCISMGCIHKKRIHDFSPKFYSSNLNFCAKITENGTKWPLYREICLIPPRVMVSSALGLKLGVFGFLPTTHAKTNTKQNANIISVCCAAFYACLSSPSDHSRCRGHMLF